MAEKAEIEVVVTPKVKDIPNKIKERMTQVDEAGGFKGDKGKQRKQTIEGLLGSIDELTKKEKLTQKEINLLDKYVVELYEHLGKAASHTKNVSKEMKKLIEDQASALNKLKGAQDTRNELLKRGKTNKEETSFTSLKGFNERSSNLGIRKVLKDGSFSKSTFNDYETIAANMKSGKASYVDANGKPLAENAEWKAMETELKKESEQLRAATLNVNNFTKAVEKATAAIDKQVAKEGSAGNPLPRDIGKDSVNAQNAVAEMGKKGAKDEGTSAVEGTTQAINKQNSSLTKAFKQFTIYALAVRTARRALNEAKKTIVDLDKYLTEQAMVTGKTRRETYALLGAYQDLAKQLGSTTKEVAQVATQYMRQGKTAEDALKLTEAAVSAAKVAGISASESVTYLTTALNGFQLSANDAMKVSDKFASIAAQSASSYEELAIALSKVASQANLAGMSIDYTTALLAKGLETTREAPETIGTALKTVIARMREMGDYGETLEGDTDVNNVETQLAYVDIELKNVNGELRSTEEVLNDLGKK